MRLNEHRLRQWLDAWWHQAITFQTIVNFSLVRFCGIIWEHFHTVFKLNFSIRGLKNMHLKLLPQLPRANEVNTYTTRAICRVFPSQTTPGWSAECMSLPKRNQPVVCFWGNGTLSHFLHHHVLTPSTQTNWYHPTLVHQHHLLTRKILQYYSGRLYRRYCKKNGDQSIRYRYKLHIRISMHFCRYVIWYDLFLSYVIFQSYLVAQTVGILLPMYFLPQFLLYQSPYVLFCNKHPGI